MWNQANDSLKLVSLLSFPGFSKPKSFLFLLHLFLVLIIGHQGWDGVILTEADFQVLQSFKQELNDPRGILRSWNSSGYGACSGSWVGIKCAHGEVIVIQLPWKGLSGQISPYLSQLQALRKLSLHDNLITGSIPTTLGLLPDLRGLQLFNNRLSGSIPYSLGFCPLLQTLDLSNNSLVGSIPETLGNSTKLHRLNLSFNSFNGSIPISLTRSASLVFLSLRYNNLSGSIPNAWGAAPKGHPLKHPLEQLDLSRNDLTGEIPPTIVELPHLRSFSVSYNKLSGAVPIGLARKFNSKSFVGNIELCGYGSTAPCPSEPPSSTHAPSIARIERPNRRKLNRKDAILIAAGALLLLLMLCCVLFYFLIWRRSRTPKANNGRTAAGAPTGASGSGSGFEKNEAEPGSGESGGKLVHFEGGQMIFTADDLLCATAEIMGKSTYGTVYKATLEDGNQVAVKRLREKITKHQREFETEVDLLGKIRHPNLLALRAYYSGPKGEKLLVFDYMSKGSLSAFLHDHGGDTLMDWTTRRSIAGAVTRGLFHLHVNENIIHGNLTSSNVLLDDRTSARISDFGLSRLMTAAANSNVIATAGALGYRAPELSKLKKANTKTDVYSLGVMLLELLTGKSPGGEAMNGVDLPHWVASVVKEEWTNEVFDVELMREDGSAIGDELLNTLKLALHCVDPSSSARPEVQEVLHQLEAIRPEMDAGGSSGDDGSIAAPSISE